MKIKKNDLVLVISGRDRGKKGKILQVFPRENKAVIEGVNKRFKHLKARRGKEKGERIEFNAPIALANAMLFCPKCNKGVRAGFKVEKDKKIRICRKCKEAI
ncbi:MAG: 50S ribosomal protein L24 [Patescibacteria group bacterium]